MKNAFQVVRSAIVDLWDHIFLVIFCSLAWLLLVLLIIPGPPATLALFEIAERIARRDHLLEVRDYLRAVWNRFGVGWRWGALNFLVLAILVIDIRTVPRMVSPAVANTLQIIFLMVLVFWIIVNWYALAFLFQQKEPSLRQALRNGAVLLLQHPVFTLTLAVITAVLLGLSAVLVVLIIAILLVGPMLVALISTHAVLNRLEPIRAARRANAGHD
jgi:hypothetical protein